MLRFGNNEVLKTLTKTSTFVDANAKADANAEGSTKTSTFVDANAKADANAEGSTIALHERCSGELKKALEHTQDSDHSVHLQSIILAFALHSYIL